MPDTPQRTVIREHEFEEQLGALIPDAEEADAFTLCAEYVLAREPRDGLTATVDGAIWAMPMCPIRGRQVTLYYTFDEHSVTLIAIVAADD